MSPSPSFYYWRMNYSCVFLGCNSHDLLPFIYEAGIRMNNMVALYSVNKKAGFKEDIYLPNIIQIGADQKWDQNITGKNVVVSVLDTGVDELHLSGNVIGGLHFTNDYQGLIFLFSFQTVGIDKW